jgi:hypothetical protein
MSGATDPVARLVFDLGTNVAAITITEVKVEEIQFGITTDTEEQSRSLIVYPNPVNSTLYVDGFENYKSVALYDLRGSMLAHFNLSESGAINLEAIKPGLYLIKLIGSNGHKLLKIVKE